MIFQLIFVSPAVSPMNSDDLLDLLHQSKARNERKQITGMLLYKNGHFMQVLEGQEEDVRTVFDEIKRDMRHKSVDILRSGYVITRHFPNWAMSFTDLDHLDNLDISETPGFSTFLETDSTPDYFSGQSTESHAMLLAFKNN
ncbi:MAG: BLUF domain-containing protein [Gammaproteobacteria bacterium]